MYRTGFDEDFQLSSTPDHSGFDILMADALNILVKYINRGVTERNLNFTEFISKNKGLSSLYSGKLEYADSEWRSLVCGVRFFHGIGFVEFMKWENTCDGVYCSEYVSTGNQPLWDHCCLRYFTTNL